MKSIPNLPEPPLNQILKEGITHFCSICGSTRSRKGFLNLFGKRSCDNKKCSSHSL